MKYLGVMMWPEGDAIFFAGAKTFPSLRAARRYGEAELRAIHAEGVDPTPAWRITIVFPLANTAITATKKL